jgi:hypothetical protein
MSSDLAKVANSALRRSTGMRGELQTWLKESARGLHSRSVTPLAWRTAQLRCRSFPPRKLCKIGARAMSVIVTEADIDAYSQALYAAAMELL